MKTNKSIFRQPRLFAGVWLLSLSFAFTGCEEFTEVELPNSQLAGEAVFESVTTANAAMAHVYAGLRDTGMLTGSPTGLSNQLGHYADEFSFYGASSHLSSGFSSNSLTGVNHSVRQLWNDSYAQVYACNAIIEGLERSSRISAAERARLTGEALFVRALLHFYLTNLYGDIPYPKTTDFKQNSVIKRMPATEVYATILDDLNKAIALLPENHSGFERVIPNRKVATALRSRVCLYNGMWEQAAANATQLINDSQTYSWEPDLSKVFLKEAPTTIWQFMPATPGRNTLEASNFIFVTAPPPLVALSPEMMAAFEANDARKYIWTKAVSNENGTWYHANKYKENSITPSSVEYSVVFRLAEQYLIRAEAQAHLGQLAGALEDLNFIRQAAGLGNTQAQTGPDIIEAILRERRTELFSEHGHRFMDLKRLGRLDSALAPVKPGWDTTDALFPIPQTELLTNPNLAPQNPGY